MGGGSGTSPSETAGPVIYVDNLAGNDAWDGKMNTRKAGLEEGPKQTLEGAMETAGETQASRIKIVIQGSGIPYSWASFPQNGKEIVISPVGTVIIKGQEDPTGEPSNPSEENE